MIKKILLITLFVLFAGVLIAGGINRTIAKTDYEARAAGQELVSAGNSDSAVAVNDHEPGSEGGQQTGERRGQGLGNDGAPQGRNQEEGTVEKPSGQGSQGQGQGNGGTSQGRNQEESVTGEGQTYGQGNGGQGAQGQGNQGGGQGQNRESERAAETEEAHEAVIIEGDVAQAPAAGVDMILNTASGEVLVGTGPGYLQEQGFELAVGDDVQVTGFWEDEEFKATTITRQADGLSIALRDEFGRPMWSGAARGGRGQGNQGNGQNSQSQTG